MQTDILKKPSLALRIVIGKGIGLAIGAAALILLPLFDPGVTWFLRSGILLWYPTVGAVIGIFGIYAMHPVVPMPLPWWVRGPLIGGWMNFVLSLLMYDTLNSMMIAASEMYGIPALSPFLFVCEGMLAGLIIGWFCTHFGGEGPETLGVKS